MSNSPHLHDSSDSSDVPFAPHPVSAAEVIPGDLIALTPDDAGRACWYVVTHTLPETPETIRVTLRPPLGGTDHDEVLGRDRRVISACRRLNPGAIPHLVSDDLTGAEFREGDRVTSLRVVDPGADEVSYVRRWGVWHRDLDGSTDEVASDAEVRDWADAEHVVRHLPRPERATAAVGGPRRVVVTGLGAVTPLGVGVGELWRGLLEGRHGIRELDGEEFAELPVRVAGTVPVDPAELLPRAAARRMNRAAQFAVLAAREAWGDAGFVAGGTRESGLDPERIGISLGTILGDASILVGGDRKLREKGPRAVSPLTTPMTVPSQASSQVSSTCTSPARPARSRRRAPPARRRSGRRSTAYGTAGSTSPSRAGPRRSSRRRSWRRSRRCGRCPRGAWRTGRRRHGRSARTGTGS